MSDSSTQQSRRSESGGPKRSGNRRRSNNRNRNRNREGGGGGNGGGRKGGGQRGRQSGPGTGRRPRREPKPIPLTWWQKVLKSLGLYKEPVRPPRKRKTADAPETGDKKPPKSGTRVAKTAGDKKSAPKPKPVDSPRLYLGNLSYDAAEYEIEELFKGVGSVRNVEIVYNRNTHKSKGYGFVEMATIDEAKRAVEVLHDQPFMGRKLIVSGAKSKGPADDDRDGGNNNDDEGDDSNS